MTEDDDGADGGREEREAGEDRDTPLSGLADRVRRSRDDREGSGSEPDLFRDPDARSGDVGSGTDRPDIEFGTGAEADAEADPEADVDVGVGPDADEETDPFEAMDVETVDEEAVWESLESEDPEVADQPEVGSGGEAERVDPEEARGDVPEHVVKKTAYCQRCRFFSDPPEVQCGHEGTDIVEVVDSDRFRVRGCPMVERGGPGAGDERD